MDPHATPQNRRLALREAAEQNTKRQWQALGIDEALLLRNLQLLKTRPDSGDTELREKLGLQEALLEEA